MQPAPPPFPALGELSADRVVLRDGTVAALTQATPSDREAVREFFHHLAPESLRRRFFTATEPPADVLDRFCRQAPPDQALTLIAWRQQAGAPAAVAVASYAAETRQSAEVAFAVLDAFQGRGLATAMLERLASAAVRAGLRSFTAVTAEDNEAMLEVFRDSGFEVRSRLDRGVVEVHLDLSGSARMLEAMDERNRTATVASLEPVLKPRAVAVVGVSRRRAGLGRRVFDALLRDGFKGPVYPVNAAGGQIDGRDAYRSARDLPPGVDLAVIAVPRDAVAAAVGECAAAGVRALVVITAGFAEAGDEGRARQRALLDQARRHGLRLVGPNCMGVVNADAGVRLNASFAGALPRPGRIALASQSGGLGLAILQLAAERGLGISTFVSLGNKADVSGNDLLQYGESDPGTRVLLLYLESFGNPRRFVQLARRIGRRKPIVAIKSGRTRAGSRAAGSHTAGLASNEAAVAALFRQSGAIRVDTIDQMFDVAACLDLQPLPPGPRVALVTNAGGPGILAADAAEAAGLTVVELSDETRRRLRDAAVPHASVANPVDLVASAGPGQYRQAVETLLTAEEVDALVIIHMPIDPAQTADSRAAIAAGIGAARAAGATAKPVLACLMMAADDRSPLPAGDEAIPTYPFPENAVRALGKAAGYAAWRTSPPGMYWRFDEVNRGEARALCRDALERGGEGWLTPDEVAQVLNAFGLAVVPGVVARSEDEAAALAAIMGFPVALKISTPAIAHKTEVGGVRLQLRDERAARAAYRDLAGRLPEPPGPGSAGGVLVQPMVRGVETLVGLTIDPTFGPLVAFGRGGVEVEVVRDVEFRIAPLTDRDADAMLRGLRSFALLTGFRGQPPADLAALRELLLRVSFLAQEVPEIVELDLNPVMALPEGQGCRVVDARARVARPAAAGAAAAGR